MPIYNDILGIFTTGALLIEWRSNSLKKNKEKNKAISMMPFLNQFWPSLVLTYKIHFWISFVLCAVFKCQYFWYFSRKKSFLTIFIHISKDRNSLKNCSIDQILKIIKRKCQKIEFRGGHLGFLPACLDWQWQVFNPVLYTW